MKICPQCETRLHAENFQRRRASKDGRQAVCRLCIVEADAERRRINKSKISKYRRNYYQKNSTGEKADARCRYWKQPEKARARVAKWFQDNKTACNKTRRNYYRKNRRKVLAWNKSSRERQKEKNL
jgi:hypothetical protein